MNKFKGGKIYKTFGCHKWDVSQYLIVRRTKLSVWISQVPSFKDRGKIESKRKKIYIANDTIKGYEYIYPTRRHSLAPLLTAEYPDDKNR